MSKPRDNTAWDKEAWERGVEFERERIIKLLQNNCDANHYDVLNICNCFPLVSFIKGEKCEDCERTFISYAIAMYGSCEDCLRVIARNGDLPPTLEQIAVIRGEK